jgi:hypothetical protein
MPQKRYGAGSGVGRREVDVTKGGRANAVEIAHGKGGKLVEDGRVIRGPRRNAMTGVTHVGRRSNHRSNALERFTKGDVSKFLPTSFMEHLGEADGQVARAGRQFLGGVSSAKSNLPAVPGQKLSMASRAGGAVGRNPGKAVAGTLVGTGAAGATAGRMSKASRLKLEPRAKGVHGQFTGRRYGTHQRDDLARAIWDATAKSRRTEGGNVKIIGKRARSYDSEMHRQRRLGAAIAGTGLAGALMTRSGVRGIKALTAEGRTHMGHMSGIDLTSARPLKGAKGSATDRKAALQYARAYGNRMVAQARPIAQVAGGGGLLATSAGTAGYAHSRANRRWT